MAPKVEAVVTDVRTVMRQAGYADSAYQFVLQSYASPFTENMNSITHAFEGCPIRIADARFSRTQAVGQLSAALRGVAQRTGVRFLDLARATEGREACNRSTSTHWITPLTVDVGTLLHSADPSHIVQQSFHPNAAGHAQLGRCLTEFYADGLAEGSCLRGADGNLHAVTAGSTAAHRLRVRHGRRRWSADQRSGRGFSASAGPRPGSAGPRPARAQVSDATRRPGRARRAGRPPASPALPAAERAPLGQRAEQPGAERVAGADGVDHVDRRRVPVHRGRRSGPSATAPSGPRVTTTSSGPAAGPPPVAAATGSSPG